MPYARHVFVELTPQGLYTDRGNRRGDVPLLQRDLYAGRALIAAPTPALLGCQAPEPLFP